MRGACSLFTHSSCHCFIRDRSFVCVCVGRCVCWAVCVAALRCMTYIFHSNDATMISDMYSSREMVFYIELVEHHDTDADSVVSTSFFFFFLHTRPYVQRNVVNGTKMNGKFKSNGNFTRFNIHVRSGRKGCLVATRSCVDVSTSVIFLAYVPMCKQIIKCSWTNVMQFLLTLHRRSRQ